MNKKISSNGGFKEGYSINRIRTTPTNNNKKDEKIDYSSIEFPNGIIPFCFILFIYVAGIIASLVAAYYLDPLFSKSWPKYVVSVPAVTLCMNLLWLIGRTGLFTSIGYASLTFSRVTHFNKLKEKTKITPIAYGLEEVKDYAGYKDYCSERIKYTKKWTLISLGVHTGLFVVSLIIFLIVGSI